jgi:hypothetical protein
MESTSTLRFELTPLQIEALQSLEQNSDREQEDETPELSFRAWNSSFVPCTRPYDLK